MAVKMRLMRLGKKKQPVYRVVVADGRKPRQGRYIEAIGRYDARKEPSMIEIDNEKAVDWLNKGAQPTDPVRKLLEISGAWSAYKVSKGEIHTVAPKAAPAAEVASEKVEGEVTETAGETPEETAETVEAAGESAEETAEDTAAEVEQEVEASEETVEAAADPAEDAAEEDSA